MDVRQLSAYLETQEAHAELVGRYQGSYSLGVAQRWGALVIRIYIDSAPNGIPTWVAVDGQRVDVVVEPYQAPTPL